MMRIINKIYIWFKKVVLNILGVIRDMINKDNEVKMLAIEKVSEGVKSIFSSRNNRVILGILSISTGVGLVLSAGCINLPDDKGEIDYEN